MTRDVEAWTEKKTGGFKEKELTRAVATGAQACARGFDVI